MVHVNLGDFNALSFSTYVATSDTIYEPASEGSKDEPDNSLECVVSPGLDDLKLRDWFPDEKVSTTIIVN